MSLLIQGGINIPLVFGAEEERRSGCKKPTPSEVRITPERPQRQRRTGSSCSALTAWVMRLWKSLATTSSDLQDRAVCVISSP